MSANIRWFLVLAVLVGAVLGFVVGYLTPRVVGQDEAVFAEETRLVVKPEGGMMCLDSGSVSAVSSSEFGIHSGPTSKEEAVPLGIFWERYFVLRVACAAGEAFRFWGPDNIVLVATPRIQYFSPSLDYRFATVLGTLFGATAGVVVWYFLYPKPEE